MKLVTYDEVLKDSVAIDMQVRFADEFARLRVMGFQEEYYLRATAFPFSAVISAPLLLYMHYCGECVGVGPWLQAIFSAPYLIHDESYAFANVTKICVTYTSLFDNGALLTTVTYDDGIKSVPTQQYFRQFSSKGTLEDAWDMHVKRVDGLTSQGISVISPLGVKDVTRIAHRIDKITIGIGPDQKQKQKNNE